MKNKQEEIVQLINSLSTKEKQHFKKNHPKQKDYVLLYDYVAQSQQFITADAIQYIQKHSDNRKVLTSGHISVIKQYLQDKLLASLRTFYTPKRANYELLTKYINSDILIEKGLSSLARKELIKASSNLFDRGFGLEKLLLLRSKSVLTYYEDFEFTTESFINELKEQRLQLAEQAILEIKFAHVLSTLSLKTLSHSKKITFCNIVLKKDFMRDPSLSSGFTAKYLFHWVHAQIYELKNAPVKAIQEFEKTIFTWKANPTYIETYPKIYLGTWFKYLQYVLRQQRTYTNMISEIDFDDLFSRLKKIKLDRETFLQYEQLFLIGNLLKLRAERKFKGIARLVPSISDSLERSRSTSIFNQILIQYVIALSYIHTGNYKRAEHHINKVLSLQTIPRLEDNEFIVALFMLETFIHFESGNQKYLKFLIKDFTQRLLKSNTYTEFEKIYFRMFTQFMSERFSSDQQRVLKRQVKKLKVIQDQRSGLKNSTYTEIIELIDQKLAVKLAS